MTGPDDLWVDLEGLDGGQGLEALILALRQPAAPDELEGEEAVVAAMQTAVVSRPRLRPVANGRRRLVGRVAVVKGVAVAGVIAFGVAAAAATTGVVDVGRLPGWADKPPTEAPAPAPGTGADDGTESGGEDRPGAVPSGAADGAPGDDPGPTGTAESAPAPAGDVPDPARGGPGAGPSPPAPTPSTPTTAEPTTTLPADDRAGSDHPGRDDPPGPQVSVPPPASEHRGPPADPGRPPCADRPPAAAAASQRSAGQRPCP